MVNNGFNVTTNAGGIPYLGVTNVTVGTETVDLALGFRRIPPVGYLTIRLATAIPADATTTLPITLTLNGTTRNLTQYDGTPVTVKNLIGGSVFTVFNDRFNGLLVLTSRVVEATA
jgi:hypothetical protein